MITVCPCCGHRFRVRDELDQRVRALQAEALRPVPPPPPNRKAQP